MSAENWLKLPAGLELGGWLQHLLGLQQVAVRGLFDGEAQGLGESQGRRVANVDVRLHGSSALGSRDIQELLRQDSAQAGLSILWQYLEGVSHVLAHLHPRAAACCDDCLSCAIHLLDYQDDGPVEVSEARPHQMLAIDFFSRCGGTLADWGGGVAALGPHGLRVESSHGGLVLVEDRAHSDLAAVELGGLGVLVGIRTDGRLRQVLDLRRVQQHTRVQGNDAIRTSDERVDVRLHDLGVFDDHDAKSDHDVQQQVHVDTVHTSHSLECFVDLGVHQHLPGQIGIQWRQAQGRILEDFHQGTAKAEQDDRAELGVQRRAEDDLEAFDANHRLNGDALEAIRRGKP
mmetsp:Transcript_12969/g.28773  ORF Transcript_12969/g.28773 Transcript_12969/m.28773 type:complete len:345 (-) Transcript_12969:1845-2879(-)